MSMIRPRSGDTLVSVTGVRLPWHHALREQLAEVDGKLDKLAALYLSGALDVATIERQAAPLREARARLEGLALDAAPANVDLWRQVERLGVSGLLGKVRSGSVEAQLTFLLGIYERVDLHPGGRVVFICRGLPNVERILPKYYSETRGVTDVGF